MGLARKMTARLAGVSDDTVGASRRLPEAGKLPPLPVPLPVHIPSPRTPLLRVHRRRTACLPSRREAGTREEERETVGLPWPMGGTAWERATPRAEAKRPKVRGTGEPTVHGRTSLAYSAADLRARSPASGPCPATHSAHSTSGIARRRYAHGPGGQQHPTNPHSGRSMRTEAEWGHVRPVGEPAPGGYHRTSRALRRPSIAARTFAGVGTGWERPSAKRRAWIPSSRAMRRSRAPGSPGRSRRLPNWKGPVSTLGSHCRRFTLPPPGPHVLRP